MRGSGPFPRVCLGSSVTVSPPRHGSARHGPTSLCTGPSAWRRRQYGRTTAPGEGGRQLAIMVVSAADAGDVLSGYPAGVAWEIGVIAGPADRGAHLALDGQAQTERADLSLEYPGVQTAWAAAGNAVRVRSRPWLSSYGAPSAASVSAGRDFKASTGQRSDPRDRARGRCR